MPPQKQITVSNYWADFIDTGDEPTYEPTENAQDQGRDGETTAIQTAAQLEQMSPQRAAQDMSHAAANLPHELQCKRCRRWMKRDIETFSLCQQQRASQHWAICRTCLGQGRP